jgi:hypothetical protein
LSGTVIVSPARSIEILDLDGEGSYHDLPKATGIDGRIGTILNLGIKILPAKRSVSKFQTWLATSSSLKLRRIRMPFVSSSDSYIANPGVTSNPWPSTSVYRKRD